MLDITRNTQSNVRSSRYFIVESKGRCNECRGVTSVIGFALPAGYESLYVDNDTPDDEIGTWEAQSIAAVLSYVSYLPTAIADRVCSVTLNYRLDPLSDPESAFWVNTCEHCGTEMEEEELHGDPGGPFSPVSDEDLEAIRLHQVCEPFEASAGGESHNLRHLDS